MAFGDVMNGLKKKMEHYLYGDEAQPQQGYRPEENYAPAPDAAFSQQQAAYPQQNYYAPQQAAYQQPAQPAPYQQPAPAPQQNVQQAPPAPRSMWGRPQEKVLNIKDFQQPQEAVPPQEEEKPAQQATCRVVCARGMMDCRMAITLLRAGDSVLVTMENVKDPAEMRRLVDTLSGACYSLNASITKVSRYGVYLLAPQSMVVFADQMINQMNGAAPRAQRPGYSQQAPQMNAPQRPVYSPQQQAEFAQQPLAPAYPQQENYAAPQQGYAPYQQQPQQGGFTQRMAAPQENAGAFYARPQQQPAQMPAFASQSANAGYVPDDVEVAE